MRDIKVGIITRPSSGIADFYHEFGRIHSVPLSLHNGMLKVKEKAGLITLKTQMIQPVIFAGVRQLFVESVW